MRNKTARLTAKKLVVIQFLVGLVAACVVMGAVDEAQARPRRSLMAKPKKAKKAPAKKAKKAPAKSAAKKPAKKIELRKVALLPFVGTDAQAVQEGASEAISAQSGYEVVGADDVQSAAQNEGVNLGKLQNADRVKLSGNLGAVALVHGRISKSGKNMQARVTVHNAADGELIADESFTGKTSQSLRDEVASKLWERMGESIDSTTAATNTGASASQGDSQSTTTASTSKTKGKSTPKESDVTEQASSEDDGEAEKETNESEEEKPEEAPAEESGPSETPKGLKLDLELGGSGFHRSLSYTGVTAGTLPNYTYRFGGAVNVGADIYGRFLTGGALANLGLSVRYTRGLGLKTDGGFDTQMQAFSLGLRYRLLLSDGKIEITPHLTYGAHSFKVADSGTTSSNVPDITYSYISPGAGLRFELAPKITLLGGLAFRPVFDASQLATYRYFPNVKLWGVDANIGVAYEVAKNIEVRVHGGVIYYSMSPNSKMGDMRQASGASDMYLEGGLGVAYRFDDSK